MRRLGLVWYVFDVSAVKGVTVVAADTREDVDGGRMQPLSLTVVRGTVRASLSRT
jgi:hypothetical protein